MNGGDRIAEVLVRQGVQSLFTLCGGHISPILVSAKRRGIRVVDVRVGIDELRQAAEPVPSPLAAAPSVDAYACGIAGVLKATPMLPARSIPMSPPDAPSRASTSRTAASQAA